MADSVQLTDLDVIARYSIAVRAATADRDELLETLRADLAWLERGRTRSATSAYRSRVEDAGEAAEVDDEPERAARPARSTNKRPAPAKRTTTRRSPRG
ncbi:MAG TPA: hypothetical protein VHE57_10010 [Mycobacteriales bacterium]|nr:hypothetical protein [Mycobacteriales bacterium]